MPQTLTIPLATGTLHLDLDPGSVPIRRLLGFAARVSSKRKFLLVSKVLGKHYPVSPTLMAWSYRALARQITGDLGTSVWIGMAETATGLGYGVFAAACGLGLSDAVFLQTTRYHLDGVERLEFDEAHSHATDFFLYYPEKTEQRDRFLNAQTLVLIDDEISTGRTFLQLLDAYRKANPNLQKVVIVSLVNFASRSDLATFNQQAEIEVAWVWLRKGQLRFTDNGNATLESISINVDSDGVCKKHWLGWRGRVGLGAPVTLPDEAVQRVAALFRTGNEDRRPVLVLGTGECNAPAFLLGRALQQAGFAVKVQSTTRSPIHVGDDITSACQFTDNYGDGIPNFLYNMQPECYREIVLCHETPLNPALQDRLAAWHAISVRIGMAEPGDGLVIAVSR